jgi:uncharacterized protein
MFGLIPKEEKFFDMFRDMTKQIVEGAILLKQLTDSFNDPAISNMEIYQKIKEAEQRGDHHTHEIIRKLNISFITPLEREDIYALAAGLDDILDLINASALHLVTYSVAQITDKAKELSFLILKATQTIEKAVALLGSKKNIGEHITEYCVEINSLENEADRIRQNAVSELFAHEKDPIELIKWKEIYEILELVTDKCEDAGNILESVVLKNA